MTCPTHVTRGVVTAANLNVVGPGSLFYPVRVRPLPRSRLRQVVLPMIVSLSISRGDKTDHRSRWNLEVGLLNPGKPIQSTRNSFAPPVAVPDATPNRMESSCVYLALPMALRADPFWYQTIWPALNECESSMSSEVPLRTRVGSVGGRVKWRWKYSLLVCETHGDLGLGCETLDTDQGDLVGRLNTVVVGGITESKRE